MYVPPQMHARRVEDKNNTRNLSLRYDFTLPVEVKKLLLRSGQAILFGIFQDAHFLLIVFLCIMTTQLVSVVCFSHQSDN